MVSGSSGNSLSESSICLAGAATVPSRSTLSTRIEPTSVVSRSDEVTFSSSPESSMRKKSRMGRVFLLLMTLPVVARSESRAELDTVNFIMQSLIF